MDIDYAWVSTQDQPLALQQDALRQAGCTKIIADRLRAMSVPKATPCWIVGWMCLGSGSPMTRRLSDVRQR